MLSSIATMAFAGCSDSASRDDSKQTHNNESIVSSQEEDTLSNNAKSSEKFINPLIIHSTERYTIKAKTKETYQGVKIHDGGTLTLESGASLEFTEITAND